MNRRPARVLPVIVASQFAGNAVLGDLQREWNLASGALGQIVLRPLLRSAGR